MRPFSRGKTDIGMRRKNNQDSFYCDDSLGFYVVADGVGGRSKGEIASAVTVEQLRNWMDTASTQIDSLQKEYTQGNIHGRWEIRKLLESGVQAACYMVYGMAEQNPEMKGMSTTCSALLIRGDRAYAAHVGDSRVYQIRDNAVVQMTEDHTLVNRQVKKGLLSAEQAKTAKGRNVITRAVGQRDYVQVDTADTQIQVSDRFLLCSDGLHDYVHSQHEILSLFAYPTLNDVVSQAINKANAMGGKDNITAVAVEVQAEEN